MEFGFTETQELLRETVSRLMHRHAPPELVRRHEAAGTFPEPLYAAWADAGLLGLPFPAEYGGSEGDALDMAVCIHEISRISTDLCMPLAGSLFCGLNVLRHGTDQQRRHWIPKVIDGSVKLSIGISEPDAGTDVGAIRTSARRTADGWLVNGQKLWTTGAGLAGSVISTYVRTDPAAPPRTGLSLLLIDNDTPGVEMRKLQMLGRRSAGTYEVFFHDVLVPPERMIGAENDGWACMMSGLQTERAVSAAGNCGGAQAVVDLAVSYAKERVQFGRPIGSFQAIGHMLADMQTEVEAARMLTWRAAWLAARGVDSLREITMAKLFSSEVYAKVANMGVQVMGGYGLNAEFDMQRYFRDSRSATIAAGTSQSQRNLIAGLMGLKQR